MNGNQSTTSTTITYDTLGAHPTLAIIDILLQYYKGYIKDLLTDLLNLRVPRLLVQDLAVHGAGASL